MPAPSPWFRGPTIDAVLQRCSPQARVIAETCRSRILDLVPHATERLRQGWGLIGYEAPRYFVFIDADVERVRIGFEWGVVLHDPQGILEGTGRRVRLRTLGCAADVEDPALAALILEAATVAPGPGPSSTRRGPRRP